MQKADGLPSKVSCDILHQVVGPDTKEGFTCVGTDDGLSERQQNIL
jgi:hypothetical protein